MSDPLFEFINKLDQDPQLQQQYRQAPKETLVRNGVAEDDIKLLLEADIESIKERLGMSGIKAVVIVSL